jgi:hypothetical protein
MEPEGSLPYSQVPATFPILSQLHPVPTTTSHFLNIHNLYIPKSVRIYSRSTRMATDSNSLYKGHTPKLAYFVTFLAWDGPD